MSCLAVVLALATPSSAHGADFGIGASAGASYFFASDFQLDEAAVGILAVGPLVEQAPGLRLSITNETRRKEAFLELGASAKSVAHVFASRSLVGSLSYQLAVCGLGEVALFGNLGGGLIYSGFEDRSPRGGGRLGSASPVAHGSVGVAGPVGSCGRFRGEVRYAWLWQGSDGGVVMTPRGHAILLLIGFDWYLRVGKKSRAGTLERDE